MTSAEEIKTPSASEAREILQSLLKAKKNLRLYPSNNPMYVKIVDTTYSRFRDFLDSYGRLDLRIARNDMFLGEEPVYHGEGKDENLALFFFRDGVRALSFETELDKDEFRSFLHVLSIDFDDEAVEDDVVTLLWEKDLQHIRYTVDENVLSEDEGYVEDATRQAKEGALEEDGIQHAYKEALHGVDTMVVPQMPISEADLQALALQLQKDSGDKMGKLADILFNMLYLAESIDEFKDVSRILNNALEYSVRHVDLKTAAVIFRRTKELMDKTQSDDIKRTLGKVIQYGGSPTVIKFIGEQIDSKEGVNEEDFNGYIRFLDINAIDPFMELLGELDTISARKYVIAALVYLGKKDVSRLVKGLGDNRWYVVRNIIHVLRRIGDKSIADNLVKIAGHEDPRVRKEVMRAIGELGGKPSVQTVQAYLDDPDRSVRSAALRALGSIGSEHAKSVVFERVSDRRILNAEFGEMKEYFEVLPLWKHDDIFNFLMGILRKNPFFGRAKYNEYKACAAYGLGILGNSGALADLERLKDSRNKLLSEYAANAIKRIAYANR